MSNDRIFGYEWADIQRAQQGGRLHKPINRTALDLVTDQDRELLAQHGPEGLQRIGFYGVLDRVTRAGLIDPV